MPRKSVLILVGVCALAVVAIAGWLRKAEPVQSAITPGDATPAYATPATNDPLYASPQYVRTISAPPVAAAPQAGVTQEYADLPAQPTTVITTRRPLTRSLEIVGGSAGAGAAIGAIAGGGKGAGIGALSGGGAGFIYDRLTHKKQVVVPQQ